MEVSGYPHYENVTSNMLAFLFDPDEEHELRDLMLRAFLRMAGHADIAEIGSVRIVREECTDSGNRIDLLIDAETFTICIENKIFAATNNDLGDYAKHLRRYSANKSVVVKALLGVKPYDEGQLGAGFRGFTYPQFWRHVRSLLGEYSASADPKGTFRDSSNALCGPRNIWHSKRLIVVEEKLNARLFPRFTGCSLSRREP
jgi:hypothetical protein